MKRFPLWFVLVSCGLFLVGVVWIIVAGLVRISSVWQWLPAIGLWVGHRYLGAYFRTDPSPKKVAGAHAGNRQPGH